MVQQVTRIITAHESGVADVVDPLGGSYYVEALTTKIEEEIIDYLKQIEARGGIVAAVESGWVQREIARSAYKQEKEIEEGKRIIVGVNKFASKEKPTFQRHRADPKVAQEMKRGLEKLRKERDNNAVQSSLAEIRKVAQGTNNLVPLP